MALIVPALASRRVSRPVLPRIAASIALLIAVGATPVQASPNAAVVLHVELQEGGALLEWELLDVDEGSPPNIDAWLVAKSIDGGTPATIELPATQTSYNDLDVEPGHVYAYTVTFKDGVQDGPQSNPVFFTKDCPLIIIRCNPIDPLPFPTVKPECLCI